MKGILKIKNCVSEFYEDPLTDVYYLIDTVQNILSLIVKLSCSKKTYCDIDKSGNVLNCTG